MVISTASFRDPAGFVYEENGKFFRKINPVGFFDYGLFIKSGLYARLLAEELIIPHEEVSQGLQEIIIRPENIPFVSYPYEWCFSQYKDAALTLLKIQKISLDFNMSLKDASVYNIQFFKGKPIMIDTLSFQSLNEGEPWGAYKQFCQHFLAPLALAAYKNTELLKLMHLYIDGIPLALAAQVLPIRSRFKISLFLHIYLHAQMQEKFGNYRPSSKTTLNKGSLLQIKSLIDNLDSCIRSLVPKDVKTQWGEYYNFTNYTPEAVSHKLHIVEEFIREAHPKKVIDLGANNGFFSRIAVNYADYIVAFDIDHKAVEENYRLTKAKKEISILPLLQDFSSPSCSTGWNNEERMSLHERLKADCVMALALIHHIVIVNNVPLPKFIDWLSSIAPYCIIEFVPKEDSKVQVLLASRKDIFNDYTPEGFELALKKRFYICKKTKIKQTCRFIYLLKRHEKIF